MRIAKRRRAGGSMRRRATGMAMAAGGAWLVIRVLPFWIWPVGMGLWLVWAGLGPLAIGGALVWWGWRLWTEA